MEQVSYRYPETDSDALLGVDLSVAAGEWVGITGLTGAGKSSLCYAVMGLVPHFFGGRLRGRVQIFGTDSRGLGVAERSTSVGLLLQNPFTQLSAARERVDEEVAFGPECHGLGPEEVRRRVEEALRVTGLQDLAARHPLDLSGGQLQRLALAGLLAMHPPMLVLDEPTSQLDPAGTARMFEVLSGLNRRGTTILMVEHKLEAMAELCPRVVAMAQGAVIADGPPAAVFADPKVEARAGAPAYVRIARKVGLHGAPPVTLEGATKAFREIRA